MIRTLIQGLAVFSLAAVSACGDERTRPAPLTGPDEAAPAIQIQPLVTGGATTRDVVEGSGFVARVTGSRLPAPAELLLTARSNTGDKAFFTDRLSVPSDELSADFTVRAGAGWLQDATGITLHVLVVSDQGGPGVADSARVALR